jgi:hypothetical protein
MSKYPRNNHTKFQNLIRILPNNYFCEHLLSVYIDKSKNIVQYEVVIHNEKTTSSEIIKEEDVKKLDALKLISN